MFLLSSRRAAYALSLGTLFVLASCSGGGGGSSLPNSANQAFTQSLSTNVGPCTTTGFKGIQVTTGAVLAASGSPAQFIACTTSNSKFTITTSPANIVTVPASVTPTQSRPLFVATINVTAASSGSTTITIKNRMGSATVNATSEVSPERFTATGNSNVPFTVPPGVSQVTIDAVGAAGGSAGGTAGLGEEVRATLSVTAGDVLNVNVGGVGGYNSGGFNGGGIGNYGGGGASDIRIGGTALADRAIVAGGGGGAQLYSNGGNAGYVKGSSGTLASFDDPCHTAATGGTQIAGGSAGTCGEGNATAGSLGFGGNGDAFGQGYTAGGGGGGFYGGGGAADNDGGGGGSSSVNTGKGATHISDNQATSAGNGSVTITF